MEARPAGTTARPIPRRDYTLEYQMMEEEEGLTFYWEGTIPDLDFYAVPHMDIVALVREGGFLGVAYTPDKEADEESLYYVSPDRTVFLVSERVTSFMQLLREGKDWRQTLVPTHEIRLYPSRQEAEQWHEFVSPHA